MNLNRILKTRNISKYQLARDCGVPYSTIADIFNGKTSIEKCSAGTVYKISQALEIPMEQVLEPYVRERCDFESFKSNVCHHVKEKGDLQFIEDTLLSGDIRKYFDWEWYPESFYLLAMVDYLSRLNDIPLCGVYNDIRHCKLKRTIYPAGVVISSAVSGSEEEKKSAVREAIPEFLKYNIVEGDVRDVI